MRSLHRRVGLAMISAALVFCLALRLQEPAFVARQKIEFFWPSMQAFLAAMLCLLPLLWTLNRGLGASDWLRRNARAPLRACLSCWLGICLQGLLLIGSSLASIITVKSIYGDQDLGSGCPALIARCLALLSVSAALAPALSLCRLGSVASSLLWFLLLASSLGIFGLGVPMPLDRILSAADPNSSWDWAIPSLMATIAGLLVSWAMISRRSK